MKIIVTNAEEDTMQTETAGTQIENETVGFVKALSEILCNHGDMKNRCETCMRERLEASIARLQERVESLKKTFDVVKEKFEAVSDVHRRMTQPRGITNQTVHACEMCEALNELYAAIAQAALGELKDEN